MIKNDQNVLDCLMLLSASDEEEIRSIAFSSLSALASFGSVSDTTSAAIKKDIFLDKNQYGD